MALSPSCPERVLSCDQELVGFEESGTFKHVPCPEGEDDNNDPARAMQDEPRGRQKAR